MADAVQRRLTAILSADVVGYSRLMEQDEAETLNRLKTLRRDLIDPRILVHSGRIVKLMGDGALVEFGSVVDAVHCAIEIQRAMVDAEPHLPQDHRVQFRIGINVGDVIVDGDDIYGDGVNVAARIQSLARPGGVAVSGTVQEHIGSKLAVEFDDFGEHSVKNIERPVRVYMARIEAAPAPAPSTTAESKSVPQPAERPSIAVLPFNNMSGDPEQEYFADGITEDIITDLSKISGLFVVARNSVFTFKGRAVKVPQVAQELSVSCVLEGSIRKAGSRVRITAQLINGKDGGHIWADRYDRDLTDIFAIQDDITQTIVAQLKVKLLPAEKKAVGQAQTENVEAYTYYLRGRQFLLRHSKSYYVLAKRMFARAIELDPAYARPYAGIADCDSFLYLHYNMVPVERILATCAKALELESGLAEAHASRGLALYLDNRYPEAVVEFEQAMALDPTLFEGAYFYARACFSRGDFEQAAELFERAADLKPDDYQALMLLTSVYRSLGRHEDVTAAAREGVKRAAQESARHPEDPRPAYLGALGHLELGDPDRAKELAEHALAIDPDDELTQYNVACFYALLGDAAKAIALLEILLPRANHEIRAWVQHDSDLASIRDHPGYQKMLELIGPT